MIENQVSINNSVGKQIKSVHNIQDVNTLTVIIYADDTFSILEPAEDYDSYSICDYNCVSLFVIHYLENLGALPDGFEKEIINKRKSEQQAAEIAQLKRLQLKYAFLEHK